MRYLILLLIFTEVSIYSFAQKLELINIDNINEISLGQGIAFELKINLNEIQINNPNYELIPEPILSSKFIFIPADTGQYTIGPFRIGNIESNHVFVNVVQISELKKININVPDSTKLGAQVKMLITSISSSKQYILKNLSLKTSDAYKVIEESFSMTIINEGEELLKKETLTIIFIPLREGKIIFNAHSFNERLDKHSVSEEILNVYSR